MFLDLRERLVLGMAVRRLGEGLSAGALAAHHLRLGGADRVILLGDGMQLPPVKDASLADKAAKDPGERGAGLSNLGAEAFKLFSTAFELTQPVRQDGRTAFFARCHALRREGGPVTDATELAAEADGWNRAHNLLSFSAEKAAPFTDPLAPNTALFATNRAKDERNLDYLCKLCAATGECVLSRRQGASGPHAEASNHRSAGMAGRIPLQLLVARGALMKLTTNICPEMGLFNGTRCTIVDWLFDDPEDTSKLPAVIVADVPGYAGPALLAPPRPRTWVPFVPVRLACDCKRCSREGFPFVLAKATTIHGMQGLEVGEGKPITHMTGECDNAAESRCPNSRYVMGTRAKSEAALALSRALATGELRAVGKGKVPALLRRELARIRVDAASTKRRYLGVYPNFGSRALFLDQLAWLVGFCRRTHGPVAAAAEGARGAAAAIVLARCTRIAAALAPLVEAERVERQARVERRLRYGGDDGLPPDDAFGLGARSGSEADDAGDGMHAGSPPSAGGGARRSGSPPSDRAFGLQRRSAAGGSPPASLRLTQQSSSDGSQANGSPLRAPLRHRAPRTGRVFVTNSRQWRLTPFPDGSALYVWGANLGNWRCPAGAQLRGGGMAGSGGPTGGIAHARYVGVPTTTALSGHPPAAANAAVREALRVFAGLQNAVAHGIDVYFPRADSAAWAGLTGLGSGLARSQMSVHDTQQVQEAIRKGVGLVLGAACNWEEDGRGGWCQPDGGAARLVCV